MVSRVIMGVVFSVLVVSRATAQVSIDRLEQLEGSIFAVEDERNEIAPARLA